MRIKLTHLIIVSLISLSFVSFTTLSTAYAGNNTFLGDNAGKYNTSGYYNSFMGYRSGYSNNTGRKNSYFGANSGRYNTTGYNNTFMGYASGYRNDKGDYNTFNGAYSGFYNTSGNRNTFMGHGSGFYNTKGWSNTFMGYDSGKNNTEGACNVFIGNGAGYRHTKGYSNVYLGYQAGATNLEGSHNVFIGTTAGPPLGTVTQLSNRLYIANTHWKTLIYGNFASNRVGINTTSPSRNFSVNGDAGGTTSWFNDSDARLKKNVVTIEDALDKVEKLRGVQFEWKDTANHQEGRQIGFIAQEAQKIIPEVVSEKGEHFSMQYAPITALLVEAVKELKAENEAVRKDNIALKAEKDAEIAALKIENEQLKETLTAMAGRQKSIEDMLLALSAQPKEKLVTLNQAGLDEEQKIVQ